jgi:pimeloyl-ACP methyl ester carboxylesterase
MFRWDASGALKAVTRPILVLGGEMDIVTKPEASRVIATSAKKAELNIFAKANHMGFLENADDYNAEIARFAASIQADVLAPAPHRFYARLEDSCY